MSDEEIILMTDECAAKPIQITAWMSRHGRIFGTESGARHDSSTHGLCEDCKSIRQKQYTLCAPCSKNREIERYLKKQYKDWDEETPLHSDAFYEIFYNLDEIQCFILDHEEKIAADDLRLVICEKVKPRQIDDDYWESAYPDDHGFEDVASARVKKALEELNTALEEESGWSWVPGKFRTTVKIEDCNETD